MQLEVLQNLIKPLVGLSAWGVVSGHGSFLTLNFGAPSLVVREPLPAKTENTDRANEVLTRRRISVVGEWHLLVLGSKWQIKKSGITIASETSLKSEIDLGCGYLDGQILEGVFVLAEGHTEWRFDLGGTLVLSRNIVQEDDQWTLYCSRNVCCTLTASGELSFEE